MIKKSRIKISLFTLLKEKMPELPIFQFSKATLVNLSHMLEDSVLRRNLKAMIFTGFQESSHWRSSIKQYERLVNEVKNVFVFAGAPFPDAQIANLVQVQLNGDDPLRQEWFLIILSPAFHVVLAGLDNLAEVPNEGLRQFDTIWSFDPELVGKTLDMLEEVLEQYLPERLHELRESRQQFPKVKPDSSILTAFTLEMMQFEERLHFELGRTSKVLNQTVNMLKKREKNLQRTEAKYRQLVEQVPAITYRLTINPALKSAQFTYVSPQIKEMLGFNSNVWLDNLDNWTTAILEDDLNGVLQALFESAQQQRPFMYEYQRYHKDGTLHWVREETVMVESLGNGSYVYQGLLFDISQRKLSEKHFLKSLHEKEVLLKEVHHRVKNNLQIISSLISLQADTVSEPEVVNLLHDSKNRVKAMALIHQNLYQSHDLAHINLAEYLGNLIASLKQSFETKLMFDLSIEQCEINIDHAVPIGLLINELVTNAIKHAFPNGPPGKVTIIAQTINDKISIIVEDNGLGLPQKFNIQQSQSLGLKLVEALGKQLQAKIEISSDSSGTKFLIIAPNSK